ncbi:hypothetical protein EJ08DRAFT_661461 [Tothia fuscella]|uniref:F-box domain-containing protein n=1 Tax=Tothia fuscella TaxID=1048955 RepID=A0A9P4NQV1_9PEZI|nr:hypothetical protein EJ08DRAFT_661461 [Tothia fuscella]
MDRKRAMILRRKLKISSLNTSQSALLKLPNEILFLMSDLLPDTTKLALRIASRQLYYSLGELTTVPQEARHAVMQLLTFDQAVLANTEPIAVRPGVKKYLCASCRTWHENALFSAAQLAEPPQSRHCTADVAPIRLCSAHSYDRAEILEMFARLGNDTAARYNTDVICQSHDDRDLGTDERQPDRRREMYRKDNARCYISLIKGRKGGEMLLLKHLSPYSYDEAIWVLSWDGARFGDQAV